MTRWQTDDPGMYDPRPRDEDYGPLFSAPAPSYPVDTSQEAAAKIQPIVGGLRWQVLKLVCEAPDGLTTREIKEITKLEHQSASPRVWEMTRRMSPPLLVYSPDKRSGSHVVRATEAGRALYEKLRELAA